MRIQGAWIYDDEGRRLIPRGCNLGGSSKTPAAPQLSWVGKPFPLEEAGERFAELAAWGFTFNRLVVPWEAVEHDAAGVYDEAYLAYLRKLLLIAEKHGVRVFIDPHQDVWGRAAGGDGAPAWTLEALGIDTSRLEAAGAVLPRSVTGIVPPERRPPMTWPAGNNRYAAAAMFTLFFAGNVYAPETRIAGENAQDWLQTRYIEAFAHARRRLKNCAAVAGWGVMNEPHPGFTGCTNLERLENNWVAAGPMPSPFAAMAAASGHTTNIPVYTTGVFGVKQKGTAVLNPDKVSIFKEGFTCPWKTAGVWTDEDGEPRLLRPDHFARHNGRPARFTEDFLAPFTARFIRRLGEADEKTFFFIEGVPAGISNGTGVGDSALSALNALSVLNDEPPAQAEGRQARLINAFHWYDGPSLFLKQFRPWLNYNVKTGGIVLGKKAVAALYREQLAGRLSPGMPNLAGEFGLPFDLFRGRAFKTGDYRIHEEALAMYYDALDEFLLGSCIWCYSADNTFSRGDSWNNEDFSIVTRGGGGPLLPRAAAGWLRPYPLAAAGTPLFFNWDRRAKRLRFRYRAERAVTAPTLLFIPDSLWDAPPEITIQPADAGITAEYQMEKRLIAIQHHGFEGEAEVCAWGPPSRKFHQN